MFSDLKELKKSFFVKLFWILIFLVLYTGNLKAVKPEMKFILTHFCLQTGFSGNMIILSVFYAGGYMMNESLITIGELSAFLLYAAYIGISLSGTVYRHSFTPR